MRESVENKITLKEQAHLFKVLALLIQASVSFVDSFTLLEREEENARCSQIYSEILQHLCNGHSLSVALAKASPSFSGKLLALIRLGETSGMLVKTLQVIAEDLEAEQKTLQQLKASLTYPFAIGLCALASLAGLLFFFLPRMAALLEGLKAEVPYLITFVLDTVATLADGLVLFALAQIVLFGTFICLRLLKRPEVRLKFDYFLLQMPLLGTLISDLNAYRFATGLKVLLDSGCHLVSGLKILEPSLTNTLLQRKLKAVSGRLQNEGVDLSQAMSAENMFSPPFYFLLSSAEEAGKTEQVLTIIAQFYRDRFEHLLELIVVILEPAILLFLGLVVGLVTLSFFLPLMQTLGQI